MRCSHFWTLKCLTKSSNTSSSRRSARICGLGIPDCTEVKELISRVVEVSLSEKHERVREAITKLLSTVAVPGLTPINPRTS